MNRSFLYFLAVLVGTHASFAAENPFAAAVRTTEPLTPLEEEKTFNVPAGFRMQLFAAEPDIYKPMNLAWDARGRLWATTTLEYPIPVPADQEGRDAIIVMEDTDHDGRADRFTRFAEGLNIPIGLYPWKDGVIVWSIPNIWHIRDTDGDGKGDLKERLYGPLGFELDTHGMNASFRRGFDGWLYITHGFRNETTIRGKDGSEVQLQSGNSYRVRLDGSRVEQNTHGQVNPFGMCLDPWGDLYTADCHSSPVYQLIRGAYYPSFGKPHDGLGFAPTVISHSHGSTAIAGIVWSSDPSWPAEYQDNVFIGNVMTSRVNRDRITFAGSSPSGQELPDLVSSSDPWFRPVDLQFGPDGALYIADFYNRIIGHYEVPLDHPGRDRHRGRIWRLSYAGRPGESIQERRPLPPLTDAAAWARELDHPLAVRRQLALDVLRDRLGQEAFPALKEMLQDSTTSAQGQALGLWARQSLGALDERGLQAAFQSGDWQVRLQAIRVAGAQGESAPVSLLIAGLQDPHAKVHRAAVEAVGLKAADVKLAQGVLQLLETADSEDVHLIHTARIALRNQLKDPTVFQTVADQSASNEAALIWLEGVVPALAHPPAGEFLVSRLKQGTSDPQLILEHFEYAAHHARPESGQLLANLAQALMKDDPVRQWRFFDAVRKGWNERKGGSAPWLDAWARALVPDLLARMAPEDLSWSYRHDGGGTNPRNPWFLQERTSQDGEKAVFLCSLPPGGERWTGTMRSPAFTVPAKLRFCLAGHRGFPDQPAHDLNVVRLVADADGRILATAFPPRHDMARWVEWDLKAYEGIQARLELTDGDTGRAYAWLAVGRLEPSLIPWPANHPADVEDRLMAAIQLVEDSGMKDLVPRLRELMATEAGGAMVQSRIAELLSKWGGSEALASARLLKEVDWSPAARRALVEGVLKGIPSGVTLAEALPSASGRLQKRAAQELSRSRKGAEALVELLEQGRLGRGVLRDAALDARIRAALGEGKVLRQYLAVQSDLPAEEEGLQEKIDHYSGGFSIQSGFADSGRELFKVACSACHQVAGQGGLVGPQLDGVAGRGLARLTEDILAPNRNVDPAFQVEDVTLKDGEIVSGLPRREEKGHLVLADASGREVQIPLQSIASRTRSTRSLMPANFGELFSREQFHQLLTFLQEGH